MVTMQQAAANHGVTHAVIRQWLARGLLQPVNPGARPVLLDDLQVAEVRLRTRRDRARLAVAMARLDNPLA